MIGSSISEAPDALDSAACRTLRRIREVCGTGPGAQQDSVLPIGCLLMAFMQCSGYVAQGCRLDGIRPAAVESRRKQWKHYRSF